MKQPKDLVKDMIGHNDIKDKVRCTWCEAMVKPENMPEHLNNCRTYKILNKGA